MTTETYKLYDVGINARVVPPQPSNPQLPPEHILLVTESSDEGMALLAAAGIAVSAYALHKRREVKA